MKYAIIAVLALAGCMPEGPLDETHSTLSVVPVTNETSFGPDFSKMDWTLTEVDGKPVSYATTMNLGATGVISGQAPCNRYTGSVKIDGKSFVPGMIASTKMACENLAAEGEFFAILAGVQTVDRSEGQMTLQGGGHSLTFVQPIN